MLALRRVGGGKVASSACRRRSSAETEKEVRVWSNSMATAAFTSTVFQTLGLLRHDWSVETRAILAGEYSFWIGSGISRERFPDLEVLLRRLLETLQDRCDHSMPTCPLQRALPEILLL